MSAYDVVAMFEARVAKHFGVKHGIAVDCCTSAIFLSLKYRMADEDYNNGVRRTALIPARTYISVPFALMDAGLMPRFHDEEWAFRGYYDIRPWGVYDAAKLWRRPPGAVMGPRGLWCISFHIKKPIPIGRGGMILTNDAKAAAWLRKARYDGRTEGVPLAQDNITEQGWHRYMTPEQAARGMALMDIYPDCVDIPDEEYPDLREMPVFKGAK